MKDSVHKRELRKKNNAGTECSTKQNDPGPWVPGESSKAVLFIDGGDDSPKSVKSTLDIVACTKARGGPDNSVQTPGRIVKQTEVARCEPGMGQSATGRPPVSKNTDRSPSDHEHSLSYFRVFLTSLCNFFNPIIINSANLAMSPVCHLLVVIAAVYAVYLTIRGDIQEIWRDVENAGEISGDADSWTIEQGSATAKYLGQGLLYAKNSVIQSGATLTSYGGYILCESLRFVGVGAMLGSSCIRSDDKSFSQTLNDTLNDTTSTLKFWGEVSEVILPHSNHFQAATAVLDRQRVALEYSDISFPTKHLAIEILGKYSEHLRNAGDEIYSVSLGTEGIIKMMVLHLLTIEEDLKRLAVSRRFWSPEKQRQILLFDKLWDLLGRNLYYIEQLLHIVHQCTEAVELVYDDGNKFTEYLWAGVEYLEQQQQIKDRGSIFFLGKKDERLEAIRPALQSPFFVTPEMLDRLNASLHRLKRHRQDSKEAREKLLHTEQMSTQDLRIVLEVLRLTIERLSGTADKVERAQAEANTLFGEEMRSEYFEVS